MRKSIIFSAVCLLGVLRAAPATDGENDTIVIRKKVLDKSLVKYQAQYDIVEILVPLGGIFSDYDYVSGNTNDSNEIVFFVEADIQNGERVDRGLYLYKNGHAKNILPTGRTAIDNLDDNYNVFFGASDGLFFYDADSESAVKYGPITDGIISIAVDQFKLTFFILTDNHKLYNVSKNGETKDLIIEVEDAQEIVVDCFNNIYYYNSNKEVFIRTVDGVIQVQDLPPNPKSLKLIRPFIWKDGVPLMVDNSLYFLYANGTSAASHFEYSPDARPTAFGSPAVTHQYYAVNKKLYEYNLVTHVTKPTLFKDKSETIRYSGSVIRVTSSYGSKRS